MNATDRARVLVVDAKRQYLEEVEPAVARYALRHDLASVLYKSPFTIRLAEGLQRCPRPPARTARSNVIVERINSMAPLAVNPAQAIQRYNDFFKNCVDETVWVRALPPIDRATGKPVQAGLIQHTMTITDNGTPYRVPPITLGDPVCLTVHAPYEVIKRSPDLRTSVMRGAVTLMTQAEADAHFALKAKTLRTTPEAVRAAAQVNEERFLTHEPLVDSSKAGLRGDARAIDAITSRQQQQNNEPIVMAEEVIKPYVIHLCQGVSAEIEEGRRTPANELLAKLSEIEGTLTMDDLEHVRAHGYYTSVKKWAQGKQAELASAHEVDDLKDSGAPTAALAR